MCQFHFCVRWKKSETIQWGLYNNKFHLKSLSNDFLFFPIKTLLGPILKNTPAGMSLRQFFHYLQLVNAKKFQFYDYKSEENLERYKSETPPEYRTSNINVKMQILYGTHDLLSTPEVSHP